MSESEFHGHDQISSVTWVIRWSLAILLLAGLPYLLLALFPPKGFVFLGSIGNAADTSHYLAAMRAGTRGEWLRGYPFTTEPHMPALYYPFYVVLGKLFPPTVLSFHLVRLGCALVLLATVYHVAGFYFEDEYRRRTAFLFITLGSGWGWLLFATGLYARGWLPVDLLLPEFTVFGSLFVNPHFAAFTALELVIFILYLRSIRHPRDRLGLRKAGLASLCALVASLLLPYGMITIYAVLATYAFWMVWRKRTIRTAGVSHAVVIVAPSLLVIGYYVILFSLAPFWNETARNWEDLFTFSLLDYILGYGLVGLLALLGAAHWLRSSELTDNRRFLLLWVGVNVLLILSPFRYQERLSQGLSVAVGLLATVGTVDVIVPWICRQVRPTLTRFSPNPALTLRNVALILSVPSSLFLVFAGLQIRIMRQTFPYYLPKTEMEAVTWLSTQAVPHCAVLASYPIGNIIPGRTNCRTFLGDQFETLRIRRKLELLHHFFDSTTTDYWRRAFLADNKITYLYYGREEQNLGGFRPQLVRYLVPIYEQGEVTIFQVQTLTTNEGDLLCSR